MVTEGLFASYFGNQRTNISEQALNVAPEQVHLKFNVAFVQIQLATTMYSLNETQRSSQQVQDVANGLELAIAALDEVAAHPRCPYPKDDVNQRANMARNTVRKQLERAIASQKEYEEKNKEQLRAAMERRQAELRRREEERQEALEKEHDRLTRIRQERKEIEIRDRKLAEQRVEEQRAIAAAEMTTDSETGTQIRRKRKAPKTKGERRPKNRSRGKDNVDSEDAEDEPVSKKRRRGKKESTEYKSAEVVADSDDNSVLQQAGMGLEKRHTPRPDRDSVEEDDLDVGGVSNKTVEDEETETGSRYRPQKQSRRTHIVDESDEDE